jgi:hypothetical protein
MDETTTTVVTTPNPIFNKQTLTAMAATTVLIVAGTKLVTFVAMKFRKRAASKDEYVEVTTK